MDRRRFFKTSALSLGAVAANDVPVLGKKKVDLSTQRILEPQGWIEEPARRIPVADSADVIAKEKEKLQGYEDKKKAVEERLSYLKEL